MAIEDSSASTLAPGLRMICDMRSTSPPLVPNLSYSIRFVADNSEELAATSAAEFKRRTREIVVRERHRNSVYVLNHEIGHALLDHVQICTWVCLMDEAPKIWAEFLTTSVAKSYQRRQEMTPGEAATPKSYDWMEVSADLYMCQQIGKLTDCPSLVALLNRLIQEGPHQSPKAKALAGNPMRP